MPSFRKLDGTYDLMVADNPIFEGLPMSSMNSNGAYFLWDWALWMGFIILMFSSAGSWGYTYRAHRKFDGAPRKDAATILSERYASGEITRDQYREMRLEIAVL